MIVTVWTVVGLLLFFSFHLISLQQNASLVMWEVRQAVLCAADITLEAGHLGRNGDLNRTDYLFD
jgi:hypothetical protein